MATLPASTLTSLALAACTLPLLHAQPLPPSGRENVPDAPEHLPALPALSAAEQADYNRLCAFLSRYDAIGETAVYGFVRDVRPSPDGGTTLILEQLPGFPARRQGTLALHCLIPAQEEAALREAQGCIALIHDTRATRRPGAAPREMVLEGLRADDLLLLPAERAPLLRHLLDGDAPLCDSLILFPADCVLPSLPNPWERGCEVYEAEIRILGEARDVLASSLSEAERAVRLRELARQAEALDTVDWYNAGEGIAIALTDTWFHDYMIAISRWLELAHPYLHHASGTCPAGSLSEAVLRLMRAIEPRLCTP